MSTAQTPVQTGQLALMSIVYITVSMFIGTIARGALSPMQELVRGDLEISDNQIALLQGLAIALPLTVLAFPIGRLVDRINRARLLFALTLACTVGSTLTAFAHSFTLMFAARMLVGTAVTGMVMTSVSLISDLSGPASRGRLMMMLGLGQVFGGATSYALVGVLLRWLPLVAPRTLDISSMTPWRLVQLSFAFLTLIVAMLTLSLREPERKELGQAAGGNIRAVLREFWTYRRVFIPLMVGLATINMADAAADIWAVPVLTRTFHQRPEDFGGWMGLLVLIAGVGGSAAGGLLSDFGQKLSGRGGILLGSLIGAGLSIPFAFYPLMSNVQAFAFMFGFFVTSGACNAVASVAAIAVLVPNELRGVSVSIFGAISMLVSFGIAPSLVSLTAQAMGRGTDIALPLTIIGVSTSVIGTVAFLLAMRSAGSLAALVGSEGERITQPV